MENDVNRLPLVSGVYLALVRRLHFLVLLALIVPCLCLTFTFSMSPPEADAARAHLLPLYACTLTLALPVSFLYLLQEKLKNLGSFLLCALPVLFLFLAGLCYLEMGLDISVRGAEQVPQALILLIYLFDAIRMRTNDNSRKKAKVQEDRSWTGNMYLLPLPSLLILIPFAVLYVSALFFHSHEIAQAALIGAILYFFLVLPYHALARRNAFLEGRHHISRVPVRQIARLQAAELARILVPCALIAAAALMTSGGRRFLDLPKIVLPFADLFPRSSSPARGCFLRRLIAGSYFEKRTPPPEWLVRLFQFAENVLTIFMTVVLAYALWWMIRSLWRRFRKYPAEESPASFPGGTKDEHISLRKPHAFSASVPGRSPVRRRYRRTILRYRGAPPEPCETPSRMEELAGLPDTPQMRELHDSYERARYGRPDGTFIQNL